eukprot:364406-Chlamydomonas_euryale.AAC.4
MQLYAVAATMQLYAAWCHHAVSAMDEPDRFQIMVAPAAQTAWRTTRHCEFCTSATTWPVEHVQQCNSATVNSA